MTARANAPVKAKIARVTVFAMRTIVETVRTTAPVVTAIAAYPLVMNISGEGKNKILLDFGYGQS